MTLGMGGGGGGKGDVKITNHRLQAICFSTLKRTHAVHVSFIV